MLVYSKRFSILSVTDILNSLFLYLNKALFINQINENKKGPASRNGVRSYYRGGEVDLIADGFAAECATFTLQLQLLHTRIALRVY